jgi:hypothetical protein
MIQKSENYCGPFSPKRQVPTMKFLTVCDGGNVRSHAIAYILKHEYGNGKHEAIAIGRVTSSPETIQYMCNWADKIIITMPHMIESIPEGSRDKVLVADLGKDIWGVSMPQDLYHLAGKATDEILRKI